MNTRTNEARIAGLGEFNETVEAGEAQRHAQNAFLTELPGIAFGIITLAYIVTSLIGLAA